MQAMACSALADVRAFFIIVPLIAEVQETYVGSK